MDVEKYAGLQAPLSGYPSLATFIASDRDQTSAIFKRFNRLAARHLLHLQSQLAELQAEQDGLDQQECLSSLEVKQYSRNWKEFSETALIDPQQKRRKDLAERIGRTLKDYREAMFYESHLASLPRPTKRTLHAFRYHFFNCNSGSPYPTLGAQSSRLFDDADDLLALHAEDRDRLTAFLQDRCSWLCRSSKTQNGIIYGSDQVFVRLVVVISTVNAAVLLVGAIVSLYAIKSARTKLGIIALFTALFAVNVGILTNARQAELFSATATYAAVLVVFVSGNLAVSNSNSS